MNDSPTKVDYSVAFAAMAERIVKNKDESFGGAFVVVPPAGAGEPLQALVINAGVDGAMFWQVLQAQITVALGNIQQQQANPYGRR